MARAPRPSEAADIVAQPTRTVIPIRESAALEAQVQAADFAGEVVNRLRDAQIETELAEADANASRVLADLSEQAAQDDDWENTPERYGGLARTALAQLGSSLRGQKAANAWRLRTTALSSRFDIEARRLARERGMTLARAGIVRLQDMTFQEVERAGVTDDQRREAVTRFTDLVSRQQEAGLIDDDQAEQILAQFAQGVRTRHRDALEGDIYARLENDPEALLADLNDPESAYTRGLEPGRRGQFIRMAEGEAERAIIRRGDAVIADALTHTARTGEIIPETDPRFADIWEAAGQDVRLRYAGQAAQARAAHQLASAIGDTSGLSYAEILAAADDATPRGDGARAAARVIAQDPVAYVLRTQPLVERLRAQMVTAAQAAQNAPDDAEAQRAAAGARRAYLIRLAEAQVSLGLTRGQIRLLPDALVDRWASGVRAMAPPQQQAALNSLEATIARQSGFDLEEPEQAAIVGVIADQHREAFYAMQGEAAPVARPDEGTGVTPQAARGRDYETTRDMVIRAIQAGNIEDADALIRGMPNAERRQLEQELQDRGVIEPMAARR